MKTENQSAQIDLHKSPRALMIGDTAFFESKAVDAKNQQLFGKWLLTQEWFKPFMPASMPADLPDEDFGDLAISYFLMQDLERAYFKARAEKNAPAWLEYIPTEIARKLEFEYIIRDAFDQYKIVPCLPHSGIGYVVFEGGLIQEIDNVFGLHRLNGVRQLASLHDPVIGEGECKIYPTPFHHTRYVHSLDVCAIATLIGKRCGLSQNDFITLRVAAQSHDALTPAGGDTIKAIDWEGLDEDAHYPELFLRPGWKEFRDKYNISEAVLAETILGKGLLGSILDISDKLAYTGRDLEMFLSKNRYGGHAWENFGDSYDRMMSLISANPYPCSVWDCAELKDGQLVFTDKDRLADFFHIRALMFKILYNNASARFSEAGFVGEVAKVLYEDQVITRAELLEMTDEHLFNVIAKALNTQSLYFTVGPNSGDPRIELFRTAEEALKFEREVVRAEPNTMTHLDVNVKHSTSFLTKFKVLLGDKIVPFEIACPFSAWDIKQIVHDRRPYRVFMYNLSALCQNKRMTKRLLLSRDKRIGF